MRFPHHSTVVAYAALFVALGGTAMAMRPSSPTTIAACSATRTGSLRLLRAGRCHAGERKITWNREGLRGPRGLPGATGQAGPQGPPGTVNTGGFYTKAESDARYLGIAGTAANSTLLSGLAPSAFAPAALFGSPAPVGSAGSSDPYCMLSEVKLMAGRAVASDWALADGSLLPISTNTALFSLLGTAYGGNGTTNFALPNLAGAEPKGAGPAGVNYYICTAGVFP